MDKKTSVSKSNKKGVASFYVVIFATMLFGIVALSFTRIILSEAGQSSDDDLSRSAYDSAMAGVEDAKRAVNEYYRCLGGVSSTHGCSLTEKNKLFQDNCDGGLNGNGSIGIADYLNLTYNNNTTTNGNEILIQESLSNDETNNSDQAYTCVTVTDEVPDYRGTLTADTTTRVVPLGVKSANSGSGLAGVDSVVFKWYSQLNMGEGASAAQLFKNLDNTGLLDTAANTTTPPAITLSLIIAKNGATREDDFYQANNTSNLVYSTMLLLPSSNGNPDNIAADLNYGGTIAWSELRKAGNVRETADKDNHRPFTVECKTDQEFACSVKLDVSGANLDEGSTAMLVISLPYGETFSDFAVEIYKEDELKDFKGVQLSVDSTGRTNQLFRRVEVRLDPADLFFPYPQYELDLSGDSGGNVIEKYFWITANCWFSQPVNGDATVETCVNKNNGPLDP